MTERLIHVCEPDFITGDDGYVVFWPSGDKGALTAHNLRTLADELDSRNAKWDAEVQEYFAKHEVKP